MPRPRQPWLTRADLLAVARQNLPPSEAEPDPAVDFDIEVNSWVLWEMIQMVIRRPTGTPSPPEHETVLLPMWFYREFIALIEDLPTRGRPGPRGFSFEQRAVELQFARDLEQALVDRSEAAQAKSPRRHRKLTQTDAREAAAKIDSGLRSTRAPSTIKRDLDNKS